MGVSLPAVKGGIGLRGRSGATGRGREEEEKKVEVRHRYFSAGSDLGEREREEERGRGGGEDEGEWITTVHRDESPLRIGRDRRAATSESASSPRPFHCGADLWGIVKFKGL